MLYKCLINVLINRIYLTIATTMIATKCHGWLQVRISNSTDDSESYVFPCDQWLSVDDGDRKTFKILQPIKSSSSRADNRANDRRKSVADQRGSGSRADMLTGGTKKAVSMGELH